MQGFIIADSFCRSKAGPFPNRIGWWLTPLADSPVGLAVRQTGKLADGNSFLVLWPPNGGFDRGSTEKRPGNQWQRELLVFDQVREEFEPLLMNLS